MHKSKRKLRTLKRVQTIINVVFGLSMIYLFYLARCIDAADAVLPRILIKTIICAVTAFAEIKIMYQLQVCEDILTSRLSRQH